MTGRHAHEWREVGALFVCHAINLPPHTAERSFVYRCDCGAVHVLRGSR